MSSDFIEVINIDDYLGPLAAATPTEQEACLRIPEEDIFGMHSFLPIFEPSSPSAYLHYGHAPSTDDISDSFSSRSQESAKKSTKSSLSTKLKKEKKVLSAAALAIQNDRLRKTDEQVKILEREFDKNPNWTKEKMKQLSSSLNLKLSQVYKWNWDRRQALDPYFNLNLKTGNLFSVRKKDVLDGNGNPLIFKVEKVDLRLI